MVTAIIILVNIAFQ